MKTTLKAVVAGLVLASSVSVFANNPAPKIKADAPNRYQVKKGDTLWDISGKYLKNPSRWRDIWATNRQIKNPNLIYPGDILIMCVIKGKTLVGVDTGEGCAGIEKQMKEKPSKVAVTPAASSIPAIPLNAIRTWLDYYTIVMPQDFDTTPYVMASKNGNVITSTGDKIYAKGVPLQVEQTYGVYRKGQPYIDPRTGHIAGLEVQQVATVKVVKVDPAGGGKAISSLEVKEVFGSEIREGDRVFVETDAPIPNAFYPAPAEVNRGGLIVRIMGSIGSAAKNSVVAINLGAVDGAKPGQILDVYKKGALIRDDMDGGKPTRLPSELSGQLMIFKSFNNISYAYVLSADVPLSVGDQLLPPQFD